MSNSERSSTTSTAAAHLVLESCMIYFDALILLGAAAILTLFLPLESVPHGYPKSCLVPKK